MTNFHSTQRTDVIQWEETSFPFEHALAGYIIENPQILKLNDSELSEVSIDDAEVTIGSPSNRADITISYNGNGNAIQAIVELKNKVADISAYNQIERYLNASKQYKLKYKIGILVAPDFDYDVIKKIKRKTNKKIYGIKITKYKSSSEFIVVADIIYSEAHKKDYTRFTLTNIQGRVFENLSKARLAWHIIDSFVMSQPNISFQELKDKFPDKIQKRYTGNALHLIVKKDEVPKHLHGRYSCNPISLQDGTLILVSNQWNPDTIGTMINNVNILKLNMKIEP